MASLTFNRLQMQIANVTAIATMSKFKVSAEINTKTINIDTIFLIFFSLISTTHSTLLFSNQKNKLVIVVECDRNSW